MTINGKSGRHGVVSLFQGNTSEIHKLRYLPCSVVSGSCRQQHDSGSRL
ncbi:MAG: hypothetical protein IJQ59_00715 [Bacteroidaceae bacterium]|nr:hypothetical protein [Bacteroidaceae bacterium]